MKINKILISTFAVVSLIAVSTNVNALFDDTRKAISSGTKKVIAAPQKAAKKVVAAPGKAVKKVKKTVVAVKKGVVDTAQKAKMIAMLIKAGAQKTPGKIRDALKQGLSGLGSAIHNSGLDAFLAAPKTIQQSNFDELPEEEKAKIQNSLQDFDQIKDSKTRKIVAGICSLGCTQITCNEPLPKAPEGSEKGLKAACTVLCPPYSDEECTGKDADQPIRVTLPAKPASEEEPADKNEENTKQPDNEDNQKDTKDTSETDVSNKKTADEPLEPEVKSKPQQA